jgi:AAA domain, putative AbiEii toxin, Type IV TA system/AAA ATPase domain
MYLRHLRIQNLKLLKDLSLSFTNEKGEPRMWTVIIGENGTGKTSILQAIAMAAAGGLNVNGLVENVSSLPDKRAPESKVFIDAEFVLDAQQREARPYPGYPGKPEGDVVVRSTVELPPRRKSLVAHSSYVGVEAPGVDPLNEVRSLEDARLWFVAAYGIHRSLPIDVMWRPPLEHPSVDRLRPVFMPVSLIGTAFANILSGKNSTMYGNVLRETLFGVQNLLPGFDDIEMRGQGGVSSTQALQERHRFIQKLPSGELKLAANWLSHGYQSTIAWIADLVGHILYEARLDEGLSPQEMEGLVLIDEIDLYLHPRWQQALIQSLKQTFPRIQFVATTHSPLALVGLRPDQDEIIRLVIDERTGDVRPLDMKDGRPHEPDPRLMTGTEIYRSYFGIKQFYPGKLGELLRDHRFLAANPVRTDAEEARLDEIEEELRREGVEPDFPRQPREAP